ncbi:MAG: hypothetical protein ABIG93_05410 [archaeon]|nr:hypothetical protein [Nanoarchaeota archaeon]
MPTITEHSAKINATLPKGVVNAKMEVFYNPLMVSNRNISVLLLNSVANKNMNIALPLAGSGIRGLRFLQELKKGKIGQLFVNDKKENFVNNFKNNFKSNNLTTEKISIHNEDANLFLLNQIKHPETEQFCGYFDYIDLDPFGTPNPFISASVARITRNGIIAVTATDTAALTGTYPKVTKRKYWSTALKNHMMHEIGLRILIRKVQLQGIQFDKALTPILAYHKDHYFRIYFQSQNGKERCDEIVNQHKFMLFCPQCLDYKICNQNCGTCECETITKDNTDLQFAGPLWSGPLFDKKLINKIANTNSKNNIFPEEQKFLDLLKEESKQDLVGFYDMHTIARKYKLNSPRMEQILKQLKATRTHFSPLGIKTKLNIKEIVKKIKQLK